MAHKKVLVFKILFLVLIAQLQAAPVEEPRAPIEPEEAAAQLRRAWQDDEEGEREPTRPPAAFEEAQGAPGAAGSTRTATTARATDLSGAVELTERRPTERPEELNELNYAELCYLSNGGSSLTLTVNEATQVGSIIGTLDVNGDPSLESGNVDLFDVADQPVGSLAASSPGARLNETGAGPKPRRGRRWAPLIEPAGNFYSLVTGGGTSGHAVRLEPGTRNLVLVRPLDKESAEGEQGILVHVRCRGRARPAESSTIPVRIIVTDANDHAPEFVGAQPYVVNVSETTPIGTIVSRDILATDRDSAGPFSTLHYRVLEEPSPFQFANPLEPTLVLAGPLDYETQGPTLTLSIQVQDEGEPEPLTASAQVQVNIIDFDDQNPKFLDDKYTLIMDESQQSLVGQNLQVLPRNLYAEDGDRGIQAPIMYSFDQLGAENATDELGADNFLHLNGATGEVRLIRQWPSQAKLPITLVVRATQADNRDRYTLTTLTVLRPSPDTPALAGQLPARARLEAGLEFGQSRLELRVPESAPAHEKIGRVRARYMGPRGTTEPDAGVELIRDRAVRWAGARAISYQILDDQLDQFAVNGLGEISIKRPLDFEQRQEFKFRVLATYLKYSDVCQVQVHVLNVNDNRPKFTQPQYTFQLTESRLRASNSVGQVQANDGDLNDTLRYALVGGDFAHLFELGAQTGLLSLRASTRQLDLTSCQLLVTATDSLPTPTGTQHTCQARVHIYVAPQLIGRSLNFEHLQTSRMDAANETGKLASSRLHPANLRERQLVATSNQRSSVATVMASLQHMVRSVNFLDMPTSSALMLSALLALLVCLLLVLVASMGLHVYKRRRKSRHRQHLAATAHLRRPNLALVHPSSSAPDSAAPSSMSAASQGPARYLVAPETPSKPPASSNGEPSLISSLASSQSKRSYRSNSTDDSSVMHCGHYSVTASRRPSPAALRGVASGPTGAELAAAAIKSLVREADEEEAAERHERALAEPKELRADELSVLTCAKPGIKSYRKLPINSLVLSPTGEQESASSQAAHDSAIASDSSTEHTPPKPAAGALMALIREPHSSPAGAEIKWPAGATPQRVKRLTWDDELSQDGREPNNNNNDDALDDCCFVAPDFRLPMMSPLSNHEYPNEHEDVEQHFLFSHPSSPAAGGLAGSAEAEASGQNNCLDYTIVQSSQFQVDSLLGADQLELQRARKSLSAQHHQLLMHQSQGQRAIPYLYNSGKKPSLASTNSFAPTQSKPTNQDLKLMTTAVL